MSLLALFAPSVATPSDSDYPQGRPLATPPLATPPTAELPSPREWVCPRKGTPQTNVQGVSWHQASGKWRVTAKIGGKHRYVGVAADLQAACALRQQRQQQQQQQQQHAHSKRAKRGKLAFEADGRAYVTRCGVCGKRGWLQAFAPTPTTNTPTSFNDFVDECIKLGVEDSLVARQAEAALRLPNVIKSSCRPCRTARLAAQRAREPNNPHVTYEARWDAFEAQWVGKKTS